MNLGIFFLGNILHSILVSSIKQNKHTSVLLRSNALKSMCSSFVNWQSGGESHWVCKAVTQPSTAQNLYTRLQSLV